MNMFNDLLKNMPGIKDMASGMGENMKNIQATGEAAAGMVRVTVNGKQEITNLEIDDDMMKPEEKANLITLIKGAHSVALKRVQEKSQEEMINMMGKLNPDMFKK